MIRGALALALATALTSSLACSAPREPAAPRLVVLYATCTLDKSFLSPYESALPYTPHLQAFANGATVFQRHRTEAGLSGVAFASLFAGTDALGHGVFSHPARLSDSVTLVTEAFAHAGWDVYFWANHAMASPDLNYAQGVPPENVFQTGPIGGYPDPRRRHPEREGFLRGDDPRFLEILDGLRDDPSRRALLVTNFTVTHAPYSAAWLDEFCQDYPAECSDLDAATFGRAAELLWSHYADLSWNLDHTVTALGLSDEVVSQISRAARRLYAANVHRLDRLFGEVVDAIEARGLGGTSVVAFTADHGEVLHRDGAPFAWNHGFALAPEVLGVPWILSAPGVAGGSYSGVTRSIDVFPTIAGLAGVPIPEGASGVDLSSALRGAEPPPQLRAFSHTALVPHVLLQASKERGGTNLDRLQPDREPDRIWVAMREENRVYKLTRRAGGPVEAARFDLRVDPLESTNTYDPTDPRDRAAMDQLEAYRTALIRKLRAEGSTRALPAALERERLRDLGYIE